MIEVFICSSLYVGHILLCRWINNRRYKKRIAKVIQLAEQGKITKGAGISYIEEITESRNDRVVMFFIPLVGLMSFIEMFEFKNWQVREIDECLKKERGEDREEIRMLERALDKANYENKIKNELESMGIKEIK